MERNENGRSGGNPEKQGNLLKQMLPGVIVSVVIIAILFKVVDWQTVVASFKNVSFGLVALLVGLQSLAFVFRACGWRITLEGRASFAQCFWVISEGYLLNLMPLRLGEIGRAVLMGGLIKHSPLTVFSTIVLERLFDLFITAIFLIVSIPLVGGMTVSPVFYVVLIILMVIGLVALFLIVRHQEPFMTFLGKIVKPESKVGKFALPKISAILNGFKVLSDPKKFSVWLFWVLMTWTCWFLTMFIGMRSFFPGQLPGWATFFVQGFSALGGAIPSAPAGIGVIEGAMVVALGFFGIEQSAALAYAIFNHSIGILTPVLLGIVGFTVQGQSFTRVFTQLRSAQITGDEEVHVE